MEAPSDRPVLLFDGICGFCNRTVQFVLERDPDGELLFTPLQSSFGRGVIELNPELAEVDSVIWVGPVCNGSRAVKTRSAAVLELLWYLGWPWRAAYVGVLVPRFVRDRLYDAFARVRYRIFGRVDACQLPSQETRNRFLGMFE